LRPGSPCEDDREEDRLEGVENGPRWTLIGIEMQSKAKTVAAYLKELPPDRRTAIQAVRKVILANLDRGYEEAMRWGMITWSVPLSAYPNGYACNPEQPLPFATLASQKNHMSIGFMSIYGSPEESKWFRAAWARSGKKLDMGKACIRFKKLEDLPLDVIAETVRRNPAWKCIADAEESRAMAEARKWAKKPAARKMQSAAR
jgi:uncharacterized protein YdhG (YjbR/CyaY superfamily)